MRGFLAGGADFCGGAGRFFPRAAISACLSSFAARRSSSLALRSMASTRNLKKVERKKEEEKRQKKREKKDKKVKDEEEEGKGRGKEKEV